MLTDRERAIGQYVLYRFALRRTEPDRELYLAAPESIVFNRFKRRALWKITTEGDGIRIIGFDPDAEEIVEWLP